jgi:hypothetical protein
MGLGGSPQISIEPFTKLSTTSRGKIKVRSECIYEDISSGNSRPPASPTPENAAAASSRCTSARIVSRVTLTQPDRGPADRASRRTSTGYRWTGRATRSPDERQWQVRCRAVRRPARSSRAKPVRRLVLARRLNADAEVTGHHPAQLSADVLYSRMQIAPCGDSGTKHITRAVLHDGPSVITSAVVTLATTR